MNKIALVVIDVQNALIKEGPYDIDKVILNIQKLLKEARDNNIEVIYIQHCSKEKGPFEIQSDPWQIYQKVAPKESERVFYKYYNSAFKETGLKDYLVNKEIDQLIITGMQTEYCIDTSCKVAFEYGFDVVIPEQTNTTSDNGQWMAKDIYRHYNEMILKDRFATLESVDLTIERMQAKDNDKIKYRKILPQDQERVMNLFRACPDYFEMIEGIQPDNCDEFFGDVPPGKKMDDKHLFGAFKKDRLIGVADVVADFPEKDEWIIGLLLLDPDVRSMGIGQSMHEFIKEYVRSHGGKKLRIGVMEQNRGALTFWNKIGYQKIMMTEPRKFGIKESRVVVMNYHL